MNVLSLFSGIGGLDLGLERAGMTIAGQVEIDPWCRTILAKHWPEVPRHDDVRTAAEWWGSRAVDLVCGGFPCQPVSGAGKKLAQADPRWLWPAFADVVRGLRPRYVFVENVPGLLGRGMGDVLGDLAALGYDAEWDCISAAHFDAPHLRERIWIVAYPGSDGLWQQPVTEPRSGRQAVAAVNGTSWPVADAEGLCGELRTAEGERPGRSASSGADVAYTQGLGRGAQWPNRATETRPDAVARDAGQLPHVAYADREWQLQPQGIVGDVRRRTRNGREDVADSGSGRHRPPRIFLRPGRHSPLNDHRWPAEPGVGRVAHGIPRRVDRLRGLGNAVVPQVAEHIGRLIMNHLDAA